MFISSISNKSIAKGVALISILLLSSQSQAGIIAKGSTEWSFSETPLSIDYQYAENFFGSISQTSSPYDSQIGYLDSTGHGEIIEGKNKIYGDWDSSTGNSYGELVSISNTPGQPDYEGFFNTVTSFDIYTDILTFSYSYSFYGEREVADDWLSFGVQTEVTNSNLGWDKPIYSDYNPSAPNYRTKMTSFLSPGNLVYDESGTVNFSFGETGQFTNWRIQTDLIMVVRDTSGGAISVSEPNSLVLLTFGLFTFLGIRRKLPI